MDKYIRILFIILGLCVALSGIFIGDERVVGQQLCVDGNSNINLEGIMCEKSEFLIGDFSSVQTVFIMLILIIGGILIFAFSLFSNLGVNNLDAVSEVAE